MIHNVASEFPQMCPGHGHSLFYKIEFHRELTVEIFLNGVFNVPTRDARSSRRPYRWKRSFTFFAIASLWLYGLFMNIYTAKPLSCYAGKVLHRSHFASDRFRAKVLLMRPYNSTKMVDFYAPEICRVLQFLENTCIKAGETLINPCRLSDHWIINRQFSVGSKATALSIYPSYLIGPHRALLYRSWSNNEEWITDGALFVWGARYDRRSLSTHLSCQPIKEIPASVIMKADHNINITIRTKIITKHRPQKWKFRNLPLPARGCNFVHRNLLASFFAHSIHPR